MRRPIATSPVVISAKPIRICEREGCEKPLAPGQKKYCSPVCRNIQVGKSGGRPAITPYKPEYASKRLEEYLEWCEKKNERTFLPTKGGFIVVNNAELPSQKGYAKFLKIHTTVPFDYWIETQLPFAEAMQRLKSEQELALINESLKGNYSPVIGKLLLGVNHGVREVKETHNKHMMLGIVEHIYDLADKMQEDAKKGLPPA